MKDKIQTSIAFKTFVFTSILIISVIAASFVFLWAVLPDYYLYTKTKNIEANADALKASLDKAGDVEEIRRLISGFVTKNSAYVIAFNDEGQLLSALSTPLVSLEESTNMQIVVTGALENPSETISIARIAAGTAEANDDPSAFHMDSAGAESEAFIITIDPAYTSGVLIQENYDMEQGIVSETVITERYSVASEPDTMFMKFSETPQAMAATVAYSDNIFFKNYSIDNGIVGEISVSATFQPIGEATAVIIGLTPYALVMGTAIALVASFLYSRKLTRPMLEISDATVKMSRMEPGACAGVGTRDELGLISGNLNAMYEKLLGNIRHLNDEMEKVNRLEKSKTDFMRAAGHELKTPIAALIGITEGMIDNIGVYQDRDKYLLESRNLLQRLSSMVGEILNAARDRSFDQITKEWMDIRPLVDGSLAHFGLIAGERGLHIQSIGNGFSVYSNREMLSYCVSNILSNAVNYTISGGNIWIRYDTIQDGHVLSIENQCDPIPEDQLQKLFEPFYTLDSGRDKNKSGTGLGLYIVKSNLDSLGLSCNIENKEKGVRFSIYF